MLYNSIRPVIRRIIKAIRIRGRTFINILLTAPVLKNRYGITKRGVLKNTGILLGTLGVARAIEIDFGRATNESEVRCYSKGNEYLKEESALIWMLTINSYLNAVNIRIRS